MKTTNSILVIGYGNPGRQDDGLGPALVYRLDAYRLPGITTQTQYQLCAEDALRVIRYSQIVFVDAAMSMSSDFRFKPVRVGRHRGFGTHSLTPEAVMDLAETLYGAQPRAYVLGIRGHQFDQFEERLSPEAEENLEKALEFLIPWLKHRTLPVSAAACMN